MSCAREQITALVDDALDDTAREAVEAHVAGCEACRVQMEDEQALRTRLRSLSAPELPFGLEQRVLGRIRRGRRLSRLTRVVLPLAAALAVAVWARGYAPFVAWELSRDHQHCFAMEKLPAEVGGVAAVIVSSHGGAEAQAIQAALDGGIVADQGNGHAERAVRRVI